MTRIQPVLSWRRAICDSGLPPTTRLVALALSLYMNGEGMSARPGASRLAHDTGLHVSTIRELLGDLERGGWLMCRAKGGLVGEERRANEYESRIPNTPRPLAYDDGYESATPRPRRGVPLPHDDGYKVRTPRPRRARPLVQDDPNSVVNSATKKRDIAAAVSNGAATNTTGQLVAVEVLPPAVPARPTRKPDALFEALCETCGIDWRNGLTDSERGKANRSLRELRAVGATADEIRRRGLVYRAKFSTPLTPRALVGNWSSLEGLDPNGDRLLTAAAVQHAYSQPMEEFP